MTNSRAPSLHGHYSASRATTSPSVTLRRQPTSRCYRLYGLTQLPALSGRDEEGFSSCSMSPGSRAVANHPAGATRRVNRSSTSRAVFALTVAGSTSGATHFRGHHAFTFVTARELALIPRMRLSRGFKAFGYPLACPPSYGASDSYPGRTDSCWTHQPFLDAQPYVQLSLHTAQALANAPTPARGCPHWP